MIAAPEVLARLEWGRVVEAIAGFARTPMGAQAALALVPQGGVEEIARAQSRVQEMRTLHALSGRLPLAVVEDPAASLAEVQVAGRTLAGRAIYELVHLCTVAREAARALRALDADAHPHLAGEWARFPDLGAVIDAVEGSLSPAGNVEDNASSELARIRREIRQLSERLTRTLETIVKDDALGPVLRDRYVTVRNNRYVVPVRTDTPQRFAGIVHGTSATEKTLFVEPLQTVEINNQLVTLRDEEEQEIERILGAWTELLRAHRDDVAAAAEALGEVDRLEAIADWADAAGAVRPQVEPGIGLSAQQLRHPVLEATLCAAHPPRAMVPVDVDLPRELRALVVSGPNAGGKTVALKTLGLAALMAHAGLPVPARALRMPLFARIVADIGDEQSIAESLSTFAAHVRNMGRMLEQAAPPALALIDEIGTGTDPAEGAAIGMAVLDRLATAGVHVVATTHHAAIKAWAYRTPLATNAACDFDEATLRPTYRLVPGVAGSSIGLTMAAQLGLPAELIDEARRRLDPAGVETAAALDAVRHLAADLERQRADLVEHRRALDREAAAREAKAKQDEERRRVQWGERIDELTRAFRTEAQRLLGRLTDARERRALEHERARAERELRERFAEEVRAARLTEAAPAGWTPRDGEKVLVVSLGKEGTFRALAGNRAEVRLGAATFSVPLDDLRPAGPPAPSAPPTAAKAPLARRRGHRAEGVRVEVADRSVPRELHLIGQRVDAALGELERYVDDALLAGMSEVRIVHGYGTGALKKAVREYLAARPEVGSWRDGKPDEGGGGATIVALAAD